MDISFEGKKALVTGAGKGTLTFAALQTIIAKTVLKQTTNR